MLHRPCKCTPGPSSSQCRCCLMSCSAGPVCSCSTQPIPQHSARPHTCAPPVQAQDRIHRLGQFKPVQVTRLIIAGTIEERILKLQEKKRLVFEGTVGADAEALGKLTEDDMRFLFQ